MLFLKLHECFLSAAQDEAIKNIESWNVFIALAMKNNLFSTEDISRIERFRPSLPVNFECAIATIAQIVDNPEFHKIIEYSLKLHSKLIQARDAIELWNPGSLNEAELAQLLYKIYKSYISIQKSEELLQDVASRLSTYSEDVQRSVYDKIYDKSETILTAHIFQEEESANIEKLWHKERVRSVQYRNRPIKVLQEYPDGTIRQQGFCAKRDIPVEVLVVPRLLLDCEVLTKLFNKISAHKQLFLSKYFHNYLGFDDISSDTSNLYFFETLKGITVRKILNGRTIEQLPTLIKYWAKELLNAFTDLLHKCTHSVLYPITCANIFIQDNGLKLYLKGVEFGDFRNEDTHHETEAKLLEMYGQIMLELLTGNPKFRDFHKLSNFNIDLRCIVEECTRSYERFQDSLANFLNQSAFEENHHRNTLEELENQLENIKKAKEDCANRRKRPKVKKLEPPSYIRESLTFARLHTHPFFNVYSELDSFEFDKVIDEFDLLSRDTNIITV
ncbi:unnamed protein product [Blepharisma stoltei]|uniref:Uncharacterized protein n=1 Tax=Blepharisma stoltei TaxID=1481888 RepID=A0AAU9J201_9CILI|nr:unnamed protein product [Blepharisma stoltei]